MEKQLLKSKFLENGLKTLLNPVTIFSVVAVAFTLSVAQAGYEDKVRMSSSENINKVLSSKGFSDIEITGNNLDCHRNDAIHVTFNAIDSNKQKVIGKICSGRGSWLEKIETKPKQS